MIDQIRASKLPSNMMQFAARGALQVPPAENIEILVYLALHNKVFGELARMTLAGWDEKASSAAAADPQTSQEVLNYFLSPDNLRPVLLPALLENPSVPETQIVKFAGSAGRESIEAMLKSKRIRSMRTVLEAMKANPYLKPEEAGEIQAMSSSSAPVVSSVSSAEPVAQPGVAQPVSSAFDPQAEEPAVADPEADESVSAYMQEHAHEIAAEGEKPFQSIGGVVELLGTDYFPHHETQETQAVSNATPIAGAAASAKPAVAAQAGTAGKTAPQAAPKRENTLQKINALDVKGRIQLALKGNKEERSILIRDGTKVVALAVLEAPKLADGEVEKFASQKNVLEAVLRQIPLKRRFMKNYIVVRNLVANPRTPIDLSLGLMKNLLTQDLKNISSNKEISETIRKLALKMYKQKLEAANKK
ncbi:MAG TPA: hypothetical protein VMX38_18085 [Verrucomicrobiae bacterium]|nr:hypothetical protein [Verrucomicrobiae bacterium]